MGNIDSKHRFQHEREWGLEGEGDDLCAEGGGGTLLCGSFLYRDDGNSFQIISR